MRTAVLPRRGRVACDAAGARTGGGSTAWGAAAVVGSPRRGETKLGFLAAAAPRSFRPPPRLARSRIDQKLAVTLMQSGYRALEELKVVSMEDFQIAFWKYRASQWEAYTTSTPRAVTQGDLGDVLYLDFISFAQMATIDSCLRPDRINEFFAGTGNRILSALRESAGTVPPFPAPRGADDVLDGVETLLKVLVQNGYASGASVVPVAEAGGESGPGTSLSFVTTLVESATLWGSAELVSRQFVCNTLYENMLLAAWLAEGPFGTLETVRMSSIINIDQLTVQTVWKIRV